jgi:hypothetical protein
MMSRELEAHDHLCAPQRAWYSQEPYHGWLFSTDRSQ